MPEQPGAPLWASTTRPRIEQEETNVKLIRSLAALVTTWSWLHWRRLPSLRKARHPRHPRRQQQLGGQRRPGRSAHVQAPQADQRHPGSSATRQGDRGRPDGEVLLRQHRTLVGEGHNQYVDDGFTSPDGRVVYFSRPSFADVVAIDLKSGKIRWRTGRRLSRRPHGDLEDGRRLLVSASTANVVDVIDTGTGRSSARIPSGDRPTRTTSRATGRRSSTPASARLYRHGRPIAGRDQGRARLRGDRRQH